MKQETQTPRRLYTYVVRPGWTLWRALEFDQGGGHRELVADLFRTTSMLKRQAVFVCLAELNEAAWPAFQARLKHPVVTLNDAIRRHTARELVAAAFNDCSVPKRYISALSRIGSAPLEYADDYRLLLSLVMPLWIWTNGF